MDPVERFAAAATDFERWLVTGTDQGPDAARAALMHLLRLYACGLELPDAWSGDIDKEGDVERLAEQEWRKAKAACARLPLNHYNDVFNPVDPNDATPIARSLDDDLADIYRDVVSGLRAYELGNRAGAAWEWSFHLHAHWGAHATSAIRALHWWLTDNAIDPGDSSETP